MEPTGHRRKRILIFCRSPVFSTSLILTAVFLALCGDHAHSQFQRLPNIFGGQSSEPRPRPLPVPNIPQNIAGGFPGIIPLIPGIPNIPQNLPGGFQEIIPPIPGSELIRFGNNFRESNSYSASFNFKMHFPTPAVSIIQQISFEILRVTKTLLGIIERAVGTVFTLPVFREVGRIWDLSTLREFAPDQVVITLRDLGVVMPDLETADRMRQANSSSLCDADAPYRLANGSCNNLLNSCYGMAESAYTRWLPPVYENGVDTPRARSDGGNLPNPRQLATTLSPFDQQDTQSTNSSAMSTLWGQFIAHDIVLTPNFATTSRGRTQQPDCCGSNRNHAECLPIIVGDGDPVFPRDHCIAFERSTPHTYNPRGCAGPRLGFPRNQLDQVTSFVDASTVYGSNENDTAILRTFNGTGAKLKVASDQRPHVLPRKVEECASFSANCDNRCLHAGEQRASENPGLGSLHTLWVREHNRIARILERKGWSHEKVFQETRKIITAMIQHITYNEYLPQILGPEIRKLDGPRTSASGYMYDPTIDPTIMNSFAAAAFRFGHSMVTGSRPKTPRNRTSLVQEFFAMDEFCDLSSDPLVRLIWSYSAEGSRKTDNLFANELTSQLFAPNMSSPGLDLLSINIQRGRDHGLPPYVQWRQHCGLRPVNSFEDLKGKIRGELAEKLANIYGRDSVHEVDLYVAGVSERRLAGASVGPTFACIIAEQFRRLKFGDRFWYENLHHPGAFTKEQLAHIKRTKLSHVICRNVRIPEIQGNLFLIQSTNNPLQSCDSILQGQRIDWDLWS